MDNNLLNLRTYFIEVAKVAKVKLAQTRWLARYTTHWFIDRRHSINEHLDKNALPEEIPSREDILRILDMTEETKRKIAWLLDQS